MGCALTQVDGRTMFTLIGKTGLYLVCSSAQQVEDEHHCLFFPKEELTYTEHRLLALS